MSAALTKLTAALFTNDKGRKALGWIVLAACSPFIIVILLLCALGSGTADYNAAALELCFYGGTPPDDFPGEYKTKVSDMQIFFGNIDSIGPQVNSILEEGDLDFTRMKATIYELYFNGGVPVDMTFETFMRCFYWAEQRTREVQGIDEDGNPVTQTQIYSVGWPRTPEESYALLEQAIGREITVTDRDNIEQIYNKIAGSPNSGSYGSGEYERGTGSSTAIDISHFTDPATKNAHDLAEYAKQAWANGWGYVWGTYGEVMTESLFQSKLTQYPDNVGAYEDFIRDNWLGRRTVDCCGLIKGYGWLNTETMTYGHGVNGIRDIGPDGFYHAATVSGTIDTMPEIPGLAVWHDGHIGVYIGNGEVIEAMGTIYGVVKTKLADRGFTHWFQVPGILY